MTVKLDPRFKDEVSEIPGGQNIKRCFQCGTCTAGCPVREVEEKYNPRKIIWMIILGMKDMVLSNDFIWLCSECDTCQERCPQDVRIPDVMNAVKNLLVKEGHIHASLAKRAEQVEKHGTLHSLSMSVSKRRENLGLPQILSENKEVQELFRLTGLNSLKSVQGGKAK